MIFEQWCAFLAHRNATSKSLTEKELIEKIHNKAQDTLSTGFDYRQIDRIYLLKGALQDINKLCEEYLDKKAGEE